MSQTTTFALLRMAGTGTMRQLWRKLFLLGAFAASLAVACTMLERGLSAAGCDEAGGVHRDGALLRLHSRRHLRLVQLLHASGHVGEERLPEE